MPSHVLPVPLQHVEIRFPTLSTTCTRRVRKCRPRKYSSLCKSLRKLLSHRRRHCLVRMPRYNRRPRHLLSQIRRELCTSNELGSWVRFVIHASSRVHMLHTFDSCCSAREALLAYMKFKTSAVDTMPARSLRK